MANPSLLVGFGLPLNPMIAFSLILTTQVGNGHRQRPLQCKQTYTSRSEDGSPDPRISRSTESFESVIGPLVRRIRFLWQLLLIKKQEEDGSYGLSSSPIEGFRHPIRERVKRGRSH